MTATKGQPAGPVCEECSVEWPKTVFVHLVNGETAVVQDVTGLEVTDTDINLRRGGLDSVSYRRDDVYFACCDRDRPPFQC